MTGMKLPDFTICGENSYKTLHSLNRNDELFVAPYPSALVDTCNTNLALDYYCHYVLIVNE